MKLREALLSMSPSLALQRSAADEIARQDVLIGRLQRLNELGFEAWFASHDHNGQTVKDLARSAYSAGAARGN